MNILLTEFGSKVYGTNLPSSDTDIKGIFIPDARDIVLQRAPRQIITNTKEDPNAKNSSTDVDKEMFSLQQYLKLLCEGQTPAIDLLFTPKKFHLEECSPLFDEIYNNRDKLISKNLLPVIGYCRTQAAKYGIKGTRVAAVRLAQEWASTKNDWQRIGEYDIPEFIKDANNEYICEVQCRGPNKEMKPHLSVIGKKFSYEGVNIKYLKENLKRFMDEYGHRALMAETNQGVDWKALYHAIRVSAEGIELCNTGTVSFPRPEAPLLLQVRKGELPYTQVSEIIEGQLETLEKVQHTSVLPDKPDYKWVEDFVEEVYSCSVLHKYSKGSDY